MQLLLEEQAVRQAIGAAVNSSMSFPQDTWSRDFVLEAVLAELTATAGADSSGGMLETHSTPAAATAHILASSPSSSGSTSSLEHMQHTHAAANIGSDTADHVTLDSKALELVELYQQAMAAASHQSSSDKSSQSVKVLGRHSKGQGTAKKRGKGAAVDQEPGSSSSNGSVSAELSSVLEGMHSMFGQLLQDNYQQVDDVDVHAFSTKLLHELSELVEAAAAAQEADVEGLCQLCDREMPLTKHHLVPRDVHKDFKKRGFGFTELQSGVMVCRPCHSAIHRAVPDNKELALHYRTLDALRQHKEIASFSAWARRQRVTSKADVHSTHFRYRR